MKNEQTEPTMWWKKGFYDYSVEGGVEITEEYWRALLIGQENGYEIGEDETGYPILVEPGPKTLDEWRAAKLAEIAAYDSSPAVNSFAIGEAELWFDKATRNGLRNLHDTEAGIGKSSTTVWVGSDPPIPVTIPIETARQILSELEVYAKTVFDVTQRHRVAICTLNTVEELKMYDHSIGYPPKLEFKL